MSTSSAPSISNPGEFNQDPNMFRGFDTSGLSNSAIARMNEAGANQIAQAKAEAAGYGQGRSSGLQNTVNSIQAGLGSNAQNILNQNALTSFQQQLEQMQNKNQYQLGKAGALTGGYNASTAANQGNAQANMQNLQTIAALIAML